MKFLRFSPFLVLLVGALALAILALILEGCRPPLYRPPGPKSYHFVLVVHNVDVAYATTATVSWWHESTVVGRVEKRVEGGGEAAFDLGNVPPDGLAVEATPAWSGAPRIWQSPEYAGSWYLHVVYPTGAAWLR